MMVFGDVRPWCGITVWWVEVGGLLNPWLSFDWCVLWDHTFMLGIWHRADWLKRDLAQPIYGWVERGSPMSSWFIAFISEKKNPFPWFSCANVLMYIWILMADMFIVFLFLFCFFFYAHLPWRFLQLSRSSIQSHGLMTCRTYSRGSSISARSIWNLVIAKFQYNLHMYGRLHLNLTNAFLNGWICPSGWKIPPLLLWG